MVDHARFIGAVLFASAAAFVATQPAFAGTPISTPIVGAGLPALALLAGGYYLIRKRRG